MFPAFRPCLPTKTTKPPTGERWVHEIKHDGYRLVARRVGEQVILRTRGGYNWSSRYPRIVRSLLAMRVQSVALDGEVVWLTQDGISDFDALHSRENDEWAMLLSFDLIELDGQDSPRPSVAARLLLSSAPGGHSTALTRGGRHRRRTLDFAPRLAGREARRSDQRQRDYFGIRLP